MGVVIENMMAYVLFCRNDIFSVNLEDCHIIENESIN